MRCISLAILTVYAIYKPFDRPQTFEMLDDDELPS